MAILKHFSMKSANYTRAVNYLLYEHNEFTQEVIKDEYDIPLMREGILFDGINCDPWAYDYECHDLNNAYNKNKSFDEVKQHHYIISYDPKDVTESVLTVERAQTLGLEYAKRNFPGHQTLVCTHLDGHNHSGNIHTHIVFNSLRKLDVDERDYMERPCDHKAGFKHHETKQRMVLLKKDLMDMCYRENLHQVDLLAPARTKVTDREYYANRRLTEKATDEASIDVSMKSNSTKEVKSPDQTVRSDTKKKSTQFETQKDYLRRAIQQAAMRSKSEAQFASILAEKYQVGFKISRGKYSYLHPDRSKPIRGRMLGSDYEETNLKKIFEYNQRKNVAVNTPNIQDPLKNKGHDQAATSSTNTKGFLANPAISSTDTDQLPVVDQINPSTIEPPDDYDNDYVPTLEQSDKRDFHTASKNPYSNWTDKYGFTHKGIPKLPEAFTAHSDLKLVCQLQDTSLAYINHRIRKNHLADLSQLSKTIAYAQEHGFDSLDDIAKTEKQLLDKLQSIHKKLETITYRYNDINEKIYFTGLYRDTTKIYHQYRAAKDPEVYFNNHNITINNHRRAMQYFHDKGIRKIPSLKALHSEKNQSIQPLYNKCKKEYAAAERDLQNFKNMKRNISTLLDRSWEHEKPVSTVQHKVSRDYHAHEPSR